jgi:DNA (cytosine-5)-methyltransferase 1
MTLGSLFTGIGGFDLAAQRVGWDVRWQIERDEYCLKVLAKHWPEVKRYRDVATIEPGELERVDIICGGDPCQRNSNAWRHGTGDASPAFHFLRIVDQCRPRLVVRENPATVRADAPWPWFRFRNALECLGYAVLPFRLRACCVGADHTRDRLFLLAALQDADRARLERAVSEVVADQDEGRHDANTAGPDRWYAAPRICRGADGIPHRVDRLRSLGNAVVPHVAEWIFRQIERSAAA